MRIAIGADSAGKPLLDVIASHLATKSGLTVSDLSQAGYYADLSQKLARTIVDVVRRGKGPEVSVPRALAALQAVRVLTPPLYRFGLTRATRGALRATRAGER